MHILDDIIDKMVKDIFSRMRDIPHDELISAKYEKELETRKKHLSLLRTQYRKESEKLSTLKDEVVNCIRGDSAFSKEMLSELINEAETKLKAITDSISKIENEIEESQVILSDIDRDFNSLITWAELYDTASFESKKMIVNCLIKRVEVFQDYRLNVEFNFDLSQFAYGLDHVA